MDDKYVNITFKSKWFRIAGIAKRIKNCDPSPHWRFEVEGNNEQHLLHTFHFTGTATSHNNRPGVNTHAKQGELIAWITGYGNIKVDENGFGEFELLEPTTTCPWE